MLSFPSCLLRSWEESHNALPKGLSSRSISGIERLICSGEGSLYGVSLDASKCFDRISLSDAIRAGTACGVPVQVLAPVIAFYIGHQRHTSVRHFLDKKKWNLSRGLIQGCSISVLLCCCVMRSWHEAVGPQICAYSFVDDRLLLTANSEVLSASWRASETWDHAHHWELNQKKSTQFCVRAPDGDSVLEKRAARRRNSVCLVRP